MLKKIYIRQYQLIRVVAQAPCQFKYVKLSIIVNYDLAVYNDEWAIILIDACLRFRILLGWK